MKCPRPETCMGCGAFGECWWLFPPPFRFCADCYEIKTGHPPTTEAAL